MSHKYAVGQMVELVSAPRLSNRPSGTCEVLALLPRERGPAQYRVQSLLEQVQRIVNEDDLSLSESRPVETATSPASPFTIAVKRR